MKGDKSFLIFLIFLALVYGRRVRNPCASGKAPCDNGECIDRWDWCNIVAECSDRSDEKYCKRGVWISEEVPDNNCLEKHFVCGDGMCVPASLRCDGTYDCYDYSDEKNCETFDKEGPLDSNQKEPEYFSTTNTPAEKTEIGTSTLSTLTTSTPAQRREIYTTTFPTSTDINNSWRTSSTPAQRREISTRALYTSTDFHDSYRTTSTPAQRREFSTIAFPTSTDLYNILRTTRTPAQRRGTSTTALPTSTNFYDRRRTTSTTTQRAEISTTALPRSTGSNDNWRTEETHNNNRRHYYISPPSNTYDPYAPPSSNTYDPYAPPPSNIYDPYAPPPIVNPIYNRDISFDSKYHEQTNNRRSSDTSPGENFPNYRPPRVPEIPGTYVHGWPYGPAPTATSRPDYPYDGRGRPEVLPPRSILYPLRTTLTVSLRRNIRRPEYSHFYFANSYTPDFERKYRTDIRNAKDWFLSQRDAWYGWDRGMPPHLNALSPFSNSFQPDVEDNELMRKSPRTHLGVKIGVNELVPNDADELILSYQSEC